MFINQNLPVAGRAGSKIKMKLPLIEMRWNGIQEAFIMFDFTGKTVLVTGGAQGIGKEIVRGVVNGGGHAVILDLNEERPRPQPQSWATARFIRSTWAIRTTSAP